MAHEAAGAPKKFEGLPLQVVGPVDLGRLIRELEALDRDPIDPMAPDPPLAWFRSQYLDGVTAGKIPKGRETMRSPEADSFYITLANGSRYITELRDQIGVRREIDVREIRCDNLEIQIRDYMIYSNLIFQE